MKGKKSKVKGKPTKVPASFDAVAYKTERTCVAKLAEWIDRLIEEEGLDLGPAEVETRSSDDKYPDVVIRENPRSQNLVCVVEFKRPYFDPFNEEELKEPARKKATHRKAKYFATSNFKTLIWFDTEKANAMRPEEEQIIGKYVLSTLEDLNEIDQVRYSEPIKRALRDFLKELYAVHTGKKAEPKLAIDEFLVFRLHQKIEVLSTYYKDIIENRCHKDKDFAKKLALWFNDQGWSFVWQPQDFVKVARQTAYLLVNKILFYDALQTKRPHELDPLEIPESLTKGSMLRGTLQTYFKEVLKIDYETIYTTDFIDSIAFPDSKEVVREIKELVNVLKRSDFSTLGYDIIGRIFERLIPADERHNLGQYFTRPDVVDLILKFCLHHEDDKLLDPACGAGTFLVRAYQHKKLLNQRKKHEDILDTLWGDDIAKFPATLSVINLAIKGLEVDKNYPNILNEDFFALLVGEEGFDPEKWRKRRAKTLGVKEREVTHPRWFDVIVGNPPYTRQEEIADIAPEVAEFKEKLIENALKDTKGKKIANISKQAGIHAYFFVHGAKFLQEGGYFGFIVSNSWLDVRYGAGLQEFFLNNYKIIAIIDSKVERWFEEADVNTCIVILQKCRDKKERDSNLVRFVYLKKPLAAFIPPAQNMWEKQKERLDAIDDLKKTILFHNEFYENEELCIFPKSQKVLWEEGFDEEKEKYAGSKWGKYLRAPAIFFKILEKGKGKLVPLKEVAEVRRGFTTGANEFFYLTEEQIKKRGIEKQFWMHKDAEGKWVPNYVIKSPRECKTIVVEPSNLKYRVLMIHKDKAKLKRTNVLKYIKWGEGKGFHKRPTCASRKRWYDLHEVRGNLIWIKGIWNRHFIPVGEVEIFIDQQLYAVKLKDIQQKNLIAALLNSTYISIFQELIGRVNFGEGILWIAVYEPLQLPVLLPRKLKSKVTRNLKLAFEQLKHRRIKTVLEEIGTDKVEEVSLNNVLPDRRELDKIVMGEILGLTEDEQLEVYKAVVDLVKSRIEKAQSVGKNNKYVDGINVEAAKKSIVERLKKED